MRVLKALQQILCVYSVVGMMLTSLGIHTQSLFLSILQICNSGYNRIVGSNKSDAIFNNVVLENTTTNPNTNNEPTTEVPDQNTPVQDPVPSTFHSLSLAGLGGMDHSVNMGGSHDLMVEPRRDLNLYIELSNFLVEENFFYI